MQKAMKLNSLSESDVLQVDLMSHIDQRSNGERGISHLKRVIIEIHNFCNRKCVFCLNSSVDRRSSKSHMPMPKFLEILRQLRDGGFTGTLFFGRYHEPLSDPIVVEYIAASRRVLSDNRISLNTNGDYFTVKLIDKLFQAGLTDLNVMTYLPNNKVYSDSAISSAIEKFGHRHGLKLKLGKTIRNKFHTYNVISPSRFANKLYVCGESYSTPGLGCDRGGVLKNIHVKQPRKSTCAAPFFELNVDYNGDVVPCCNLLSDVISHKPFVYGNVTRDAIQSVYYSDKAIQFRADIQDMASLPSPCKHCQYYWPNRPIYTET